MALLAGCGSDSGHHQLQLSSAEAEALVEVGQDFALSRLEEEQAADEFLRRERIPDARDNVLGEGSPRYEIDVRREAADLVVRFVPPGKEAENLRDGVVQYQLSPGMPPRRVPPSEQAR